MLRYKWLPENFKNVSLDAKENNYLMWAHSVTGIIIIIKKTLLNEQLLTLDFKDVNYLPFNIS